MTTELTLASVRADLAEALFLEPAQVTDSANLFELGLESIRVLGLVERWRAHGAQVSFLELAERPTLASWWELLASRLPEAAHG